MSAAPAPDLSLVLPMRNEVDNLTALFARVLPVMRGLGGTFEIVVVDDGSTDETLTALKARRASDIPELNVISLSRNFGKEVAVTAALAHTRGRHVILMDSDLQHPPEAIPDLLAEMRKGNWGIVAASRVVRHKDSLARRAFTRAFYDLFDLLSEVQIDRAAGDYMVLDRKVVDAFLAMPERNRFNRGLLAWAGFKTTTIPVETGLRQAGSSKWGFAKLFGLAVTAITSFGTIPLKIWTYLGVVLSVLSFAYGIYTILKTLILGIDVPGFASIITILLFSTGVQLIGLGMIGQYLSQVFGEVKRRPLYIVAETVGFDAEPPLSKAREAAHPQPGGSGARS